MSDTLATLARREAADKTVAIPSDLINPIRSHQSHQISSIPSIPSIPSDSSNPIRSYLPILSQPTSSKAADKTRTAPIRYYLTHQTLAILSDLISSITPHQILSTQSNPHQISSTSSDIICPIKPHQILPTLAGSSRLYQTLAIQSDIINPVNPIRSHLPHQIFLEFNNPPFNTLSINIFCLIYTALYLALFLFSHVQTLLITFA